MRSRRRRLRAASRACALTEPSVAAQTARLLASKEHVGVIVSTGGREKWMSDVVRDDQRWIGEVASDGFRV